MTLTVHPRSRGEHNAVTVVVRQPHGSSPLARGTPGAHGAALRRGRFIPARAGNTHTTAAARPPLSVHPRSRGEHHFGLEVVQPVHGSSPLARGTPGNKRPEEERLRFIPARAGNTITPGLYSVYLPVHPRSRGEHYYDNSQSLANAGSSPLARGTRG